MKKIFAFLSVAAALMACEPLTQTAQSSFEDSNVYSNEVLTSYAIAGVYASYSENGYGTDYFLLYGPNTDVEVVENTTDADYPNICRYHIPVNLAKLDVASGGNVNNVIFNGNFRGIERANLILRGLEKFGNIHENKKMAALYGETLTLRALLYIDLMNLYGEVPARFEPITPETTYLPKADRDILYKQLLSDLEEAAGYMEFKDLPRITKVGKACALGMYARIALQAAGYSCRPDEGYVNTGADTTHCHVRKSTDPALQAEVLYPKALKALEQIIDYGGFHLYEDYEQLWKDYCNQITTTGGEFIYGLPVMGAGTHLKFQAIPDSYIFAPSTNMNYNGIQPNLYFKFERFDQRRDVTCFPAKIKADANGKPIPDGEGMYAHFWYCGKFRISWMENFKMSSRDASDQCKYTYLRYADILLMASELANAIPAAQGGGLEKAKEYMRPVLKRAYQSDAKTQAYLDRFQDTESFQEAIMDQRAFEFAGENLRRTDLIRWGILKKALDECAADLKDMKNLRGRYTGFPEKVWYRVKDSEHIELWGTSADETGVPEGEGWVKRNTGYYNLIGSYRWELIYKDNPDEKMYRPIPSAILTSYMGILKNDYGYEF